MNIVWEWKQHTIPGRLTLKPCLIWAIYGFLLLNDINRKSLWSQRVCGVHVGFFSSVCLRLKTSLASDFINQSCLGAILHMDGGQNFSVDSAMLCCAQAEVCSHLDIHHAEKELRSWAKPRQSLLHAGNLYLCGRQAFQRWSRFPKFAVTAG